MILTECSVFFAMFFAGSAAAVLAAALLALGGASRIARAVFDFLTPLLIGAVFFFALYFSSGGAFRLYAVVAFFLGGGCVRLLLKKFSPHLKRSLCKLIVPIKSLETRVEKAFLPLAERLEKRREKRREKKEIRLAQKQERKGERALKKEKNREKKRLKRRLAVYRKRLCAKKTAKAATSPSAARVGQSH